MSFRDTQTCASGSNRTHCTIYPCQVKYLSSQLFVACHTLLTPLFRNSVRSIDFCSQTMARGCIIRLARSNDYDQILKLSEGIYDGHDYLPRRYHTWMTMENMHVMLAFSSEKLVSLFSCSIIDEGKTIVTRAGRTSPYFRGQGNSKLLNRALLDFTRKRYPMIQRWRFISTLAPEMLNNRYKNMDEQDFLTCMVLSSTKRPQEFSLNVDSLEIQSCTKEYVCDVIFQKEVEK